MSNDQPKGARPKADEPAPTPTPTPPPPTLVCTLCLIEAKQAAVAGQLPAPVESGVVMAQGMLLCEIRHTINVGTPSLLIAQPGQMPNGMLG